MLFSIAKLHFGGDSVGIQTNAPSIALQPFVLVSFGVWPDLLRGRTSERL
jgi:hypothetical protein